ncbi:MAG: M14 family metallopeptidase [Candidatus Aminicenantes bacterium]|nr:M14 family metallopeptidase [Candidatus Aminicenantes bacterium]
MKNDGICFILFLSLLLSSAILSASVPSQEKPLTMAEKSEFTATSRYADVMKFIQKLQRLTPLIRLETLGVSTEGREIPLCVIGNPLPARPSDLLRDERLVVYIQANIHAGEVEGKEASLMLARDILLQPNPPYLDEMIILIAPIFNADGNEKISTENRQNQEGPKKGVGIRYNGQNLDLNRDGIKMESPEIQGLVSNVLNRWDPALTVDCHTTNGSYHKEPVTYIWPLNPNGDTAIINYMREKMLPSVNSHLHETYQTLSIPYGNFMDFRNPEKGWQPAGPQARYITNYIGLRNRMAILLENYAYADYKTRVYGNYHFLLSVLDYCRTHKKAIRNLVQEADQKAVRKGQNPSEYDTIGLTYELKPLKDPVTIQGWEMEVIPQKDRSWPRIIKKEKERTYVLPFYCDFTPKRTIPFPHAYILSVSDPVIVDKLQRHGILVEELLSPVTLEVEAYLVNEIKGEERIFQGHRINSVTGEYKVETREFPAGTIFVTTAQPLGYLAAYLLEAECDDGLLAWNFFDRYLVPQWGRGSQVYPVFRLLKAKNLAKRVLRSDD